MEGKKKERINGKRNDDEEPDWCEMDSTERGKKRQKSQRTVEDDSQLEETQGREMREMMTEFEKTMNEAAQMAELQGRGAMTSQETVLKVQEMVAGHLERLGPEFQVGQMGELLGDVLDLVETSCSSCRPRSNVGNRSIFPLPAFNSYSEAHPPNPFLQALAKGLNSLCGEPAPVRHAGTSNSVRAMKRLGDFLEGHPLLSEKVPLLDFKSYFNHRGVDYQGEEIKVARAITWEGIEASLPNEVASLDLREFCQDGVLHYVNNFREFMIPMENQGLGSTPKTMVSEDEWPKVARGLVSRGLCQVFLEDELHQVNHCGLKNGMFAVSKQEFKGEVEMLRLIMNLKPVNSLCHSLVGDTPTLPSVTGMTGFYISDSEVLTLSSEDVRCFFYLFRVPEAWMPFLGFGKKVPVDLLPSHADGQDGFLCSRVLPMGFANSVAIAQHIHRNIIKKCLGSLRPLIGGEAEIRRDRVAPHGSDLFRIYLDNFDELRRVDKRTAHLIEGEVSDMVRLVRDGYEQSGLPRHPKKSVQQQLQGEVQGAWIEGKKGWAMAKPSKVVKYVRLALELILKGHASQKELQVVGGGLVYVSMFRRPVLCGLNHIWRSIVSLDCQPKGRRVVLRREVILELARFLCIMPLAVMNFRSPFDESVTASDASTTGGGICVTRGMTPFGEAAARGQVRGDRYEDPERIQVLSVGLFDGISALRVALDALGAPLLGHISVELQAEARRVVESFFPDTQFVHDVSDINDEMVQQWALRFGGAGLIVLGAGPPCQGVSGLNADRRGALRDHRSRLFKEVPRVHELLRKHFPWAQIHRLIENVASMDPHDCQSMNTEFDDTAWLIDAATMSIARRPRLYWVSWELCEAMGLEFNWEREHRLPIKGEVILHAHVEEASFLEPGWKRQDGQMLPTFTTARPSESPMRKPAGLHLCLEHELQRWKLAWHMYPPYQFRDVHCLHHNHETSRVPNVRERELIMGFPLNYTSQCMSKQFHDTFEHECCRLSLLGNSWHVPLISCLLSQLLGRLGLIEPLTIQEVVDLFVPGRHPSLQGLLLRPPLSQGTRTCEESAGLVQKLWGLTSLKGEDLMLQGASEAPLKFHRLRTSIPSKIWRWRTVSGWKWNNKDEHINALELRAVLTTVKWRTEQLKQQDVRCVHLIDSLVALHSLTRGRSSSRKLMRTVMRINSYLLVSGLQPLWGYVNTKDNPADRPSRWGGSRRWVRKKRK